MSLATERQEKTASAVRNIAVSFVGKLDDGELLSGTPTVSELVTTDLTITNEGVNTAELTISGKSVPIGQAVQFSVAGGTAGRSYKITISVATDSTPSQTLYGTITLDVLPDDK